MKSQYKHTPVKYKYLEALQYEIKKQLEFYSRYGSGDSSRSTIMHMYQHFFAMINPKDFDDHLEYLKHLASGKDSFYKETGKEEWFRIFHKELRQVDFFDEIYRVEVNDLTKKELSEYHTLFDIVKKEGYKKESKKKGELFNPQYRRYLELSEKRRTRKKEIRLSGHFDMILYELIELDRHNDLYDLLQKVFEYKF